MKELELGYRAIQAACTLNMELASNGYGCDSMDLFNSLVEEMSCIILAHPEMNTASVVEFYQLHN